MYLKKEDIVIRSGSIHDAEILYNWWNDGKVMEHAGFPNGLNVTLSNVEEQLKQDSLMHSQLCIIEVNGVAIGECNYRVDQLSAEIGIKICDCSYQNKGIGTRALRMLIKFLFLEYTDSNGEGIEKIILDTNLKNKRAQHVYEKIGFRKIETKFDSWTDQLGNLQSCVKYELLREDVL